MITKYNSTLDFSMIIFTVNKFHEPKMNFINSPDANNSHINKYYINLYFNSREEILIKRIIFNSVRMVFDKDMYELTKPTVFNYSVDEKNDFSKNKFNFYKNNDYVLASSIAFIFNYYEKQLKISNLSPSDSSTLEVFFDISIINILKIKTDLTYRLYFEKVSKEDTNGYEYHFLPDKEYQQKRPIISDINVIYNKDEWTTH